MRFPSAAYDRVCISSLLSRTLLSILDDGDHGEELDLNCVVIQDTTVRCLEELNRILRRFQIHHKY